MHYQDNGLEAGAPPAPEKPPLNPKQEALTIVLEQRISIAEKKVQAELASGKDTEQIQQSIPRGELALDAAGRVFSDPTEKDYPTEINPITIPNEDGIGEDIVEHVDKSDHDSDSVTIRTKDGRERHNVLKRDIARGIIRSELGAVKGVVSEDEYKVLETYANGTESQVADEILARIAEANGILTVEDIRAYVTALPEEGSAVAVEAPIGALAEVVGFGLSIDELEAVSDSGDLEALLKLANVPEDKIEELKNSGKLDASIKQIVLRRQQAPAGVAKDDKEAALNKITDGIVAQADTIHVLSSLSEQTGGLVQEFVSAVNLGHISPDAAKVAIAEFKTGNVAGMQKAVESSQRQNASSRQETAEQDSDVNKVITQENKITQAELKALLKPEAKDVTKEQLEELASNLWLGDVALDPDLRNTEFAPILKVAALSQHMQRYLKAGLPIPQNLQTMFENESAAINPELKAALLKRLAESGVKGDAMDRFVKGLHTDNPTVDRQALAELLQGEGKHKIEQILFGKELDENDWETRLGKYLTKEELGKLKARGLNWAGILLLMAAAVVAVGAGAVKVAQSKAPLTGS